MPQARPALRKRLWLAAAGLALFLGTLAVVALASSPDRSRPWTFLGHDFLLSYSAGSLAAQGRFAELYNLDAFTRAQTELANRIGLDTAGRAGPWLNPPFYATVWAPLSTLPYPLAWATWITTSVIAMLVSATLLARVLMEYSSIELPDPSSTRLRVRGSSHSVRRLETQQIWKTWALVPLVLLISMPAIQTLCSGQNSAVSLLILTAAVTLWRSGAALRAGLVAGLLFYKPQLGVLVALALTMNLGRRAVLGLAITGASLLLITLLTAPNTIALYLHATPQAVNQMQAAGRFVWNRHVTFNAFFTLLIGGVRPGPVIVRGLTLACCLAFGIPLVRIALRTRRSNTSETQLSRDRFIAATIATAPLLMPYYVDYDLLLLAVPAVLLARELLHTPAPRTTSDRWLIASWATLYAWLYVNPPLTAQTHFNFTVILLAFISASMIRRSLRPIEITETAASPESLAQAA